MSDELRLVCSAAASFSLTLLAVPPAAFLAEKWGFVDHPVGWKTHDRGTPYLGGAAVSLSVAVAALALNPDVSRFIPLIGASGACLVIGTLDDKVNLSASIRILAVATIAALLYAAGLGWSVFSGDAANLLLTIVWCLGVINAINLLDLMDGTAGSAAGVSAAAVAILAMTLGDYADAVVAIALAGACLGFLRYNLRSPASIFLGDGGTMSIGVILAGTVMSLPLQALGVSAIALGVLLVGVPIWDMSFRIFSRLRLRVPLNQPGPDSVANWLRSRLSSTRLVAGVLVSAQGALGVAVIAVAGANARLIWTVAVLAFALGALLMVFLMRPRFGSRSNGP